MTARIPTAIVTGGSAGIGRVIGQRLAQDGYRVVAADIVPADLPAWTGEPSGPGLWWTNLDVTDREQVGIGFDGIAQACGGIDVLVNNAGIQRHRAVEDLSWSEWSAVIDVNLHGVFLCLQAAGRHMLTAGHGSIVTISSVAARGAAGRAPYATTKAAITALTATAAAEWAARGVRVNAVAPGYVDTGVFRQGVQAGTLDVDTIMTRIPARRLGRPSEVADAVSYLVSDGASYITGQTLVVDGGFLVDYGVPLATDPAS